MESFEALGRLTAGTVDFSHVAGGGNPFFKGVEFASVLGHLDRLSLCWIMYAYMGDEDLKSISYLLSALVPELVKMGFSDSISEILVFLSFRKYLLNENLSGRKTAQILNISKTKYFNDKPKYEKAINYIIAIIKLIEEKSIKTINLNLRKTRG